MVSCLVVDLRCVFSFNTIGQQLLVSRLCALYCGSAAKPLETTSLAHLIQGVLLGRKFRLCLQRQYERPTAPERVVKGTRLWIRSETAGNHFTRPPDSWCPAWSSIYVVFSASILSANNCW